VIKLSTLADGNFLKNLATPMMLFSSDDFAPGNVWPPAATQEPPMPELTAVNRDPRLCVSLIRQIDNSLSAIATEVYDEG